MRGSAPLELLLPSRRRRPWPSKSKGCNESLINRPQDKEQALLIHSSASNQTVSTNIGNKHSQQAGWHKLWQAGRFAILAIFGLHVRHLHTRRHAYLWSHFFPFISSIAVDKANQSPGGGFSSSAVFLLMLATQWVHLQDQNWERFIASLFLCLKGH